VLGVDALCFCVCSSGKTAAFLIPLITQLLDVPSSASTLPPRSYGGGKKIVVSPFGLILAPTRELATQIFDEACKVGAPPSVSVIVIICWFESDVLFPRFVFV
jgi:ATP-dependent RNA helicase DDX3X